MPRGGIRSGAGRKPLDTVRIECSVPRAVLDKLREREALTGVYRTRIAAGILTESLIGAIVSRIL